MREELKELTNRVEQVKVAGGRMKKETQHARGKLLARERLELLFDKDSFVETNQFISHRSEQFNLAKKRIAGDGVITGHGRVSGRRVFAFAHDFTVFGGTLGEMHALKIAQLMDAAVKANAPIIGLNDSGGARIQEGVLALDGYGQLFYRNATYSGVIPQVSVILGPCAGGAVYSPALTDFVFMVEGISQMFITGPKVIETVTGETVSAEELGGAQMHASISGCAHFTAKTEQALFEQVRRLLSFLPNDDAKNHSDPLDDEFDQSRSREELLELVPSESTKVYDVRHVIEAFVDQRDFMEVQGDFAPNIVIGFAKLAGGSVGIVANQPKVMAGSLDLDASDKLARFVRFCDAFRIPLLILEDVSGFFPGIDQEHAGIIRHGAKILYAFAEATVPKITIILRKAYGGAYVALNSKAMGADYVFAWPSAEIAVMGPEAAASIIFAHDIQESSNPEATRKQKIAEYKQHFANPYVAAAYGMVDDVIDPRETRAKVIEALGLLKNKQVSRPHRKHGNIPL